MQRPSTYRTRQSQAILDYMISLGNGHTTAGQLADYFKTQGVSIGLATIYRHLDRLAEQNLLRKYVLDGVSGACYQYLSGDSGCQQIHLKCESCGAVLHLRCDVLQDIPQHLYQEHAFALNPAKTVLYGKCASCMGRDK